MGARLKEGIGDGQAAHRPPKPALSYKQQQLARASQAGAKDLQRAEETPGKREDRGNSVLVGRVQAGRLVALRRLGYGRTAQAGLKLIMASSKKVQANKEPWNAVTSSGINYRRNQQMKNPRCLSTIAAISISVLLCACGASSTGANVRQGSNDRVLAEARANKDVMLEHLEVRQPVLAATALVVSPSKKTIETQMLNRAGDPKGERFALLLAFVQQDNIFLFNALQKSQLFQSVEYRDADAPLDEARKEQNNFDAVIFLHPTSSKGTRSPWNVLRKGIEEPHVVEVDRSTQGLPRIESWIDGVEFAYKLPTMAQGETLSKPMRERGKDCRGVGAAQVASKGALPSVGLGLIGFVGALAIQAASAIATDTSGCD